jgi:endonuclease/exonuclease/phosphatase family metal-dependent hydrolase
VHVPVPLLLGSPMTAGFYAEIKRRRADRDLHFRVLLSDVRLNANDSVVAGDLNASAAMIDSARLGSVLADANRINGRLFPVSWHGRSRLFRLWRLDWAFVSARVKVVRYEFPDPEGLSDHCAQQLVVRLAPTSRAGGGSTAKRARQPAGSREIEAAN